MSLEASRLIGERVEGKISVGIHRGHDCTQGLFQSSPSSNDCEGNFRCFVEDHRPMREKVQ